MKDDERLPLGDVIDRSFSRGVTRIESWPRIVDKARKRQRRRAGVGVIGTGVVAAIVLTIITGAWGRHGDTLVARPLSTESGASASSAAVLPTASAETGALASTRPARLAVSNVGGVLCLYLNYPDGTQVPLVWPPGYRFGTGSAVVSPNGDVVTVPGDYLTLGGGSHAVDASKPCSLGKSSAFFVNSVERLGK